MLDKILRTLKAKGEAYSAMAAQPGTDLKTDLKILSVVKAMPDVTIPELANATGLSV